MPSSLKKSGRTKRRFLLPPHARPAARTPARTAERTAAPVSPKRRVFRGAPADRRDLRPALLPAVRRVCASGSKLFSASERANSPRALRATNALPNAPSRACRRHGKIGPVLPLFPPYAPSSAHS